MSEPIRVVIVEDSALMRRMLTSMLSRDPDIQVVGEARDGHEGIRIVELLRPDVITMDVNMPGLDGLATTEHLMAYCPTPILVLTGSINQSEVDITFKMLGAGALEVVEKPSVHDTGSIERATRDLIRRIKTLARVKVVTHLRGRRRVEAEPAPVAAPAPAIRPSIQSQPVVPTARPMIQSQPIPVTLPTPVAPPLFRQSILRSGSTLPLVIIGASTGGPRVIYRILSNLPADLPAAILVVQHIAEGFSGGMVEWLQHSSPFPVALATEGLPLQRGVVLVAPDQRDIMVTADERIHLTQSPLLIQRPSIDIAMQAVAEIFASRAIGVLLTGMGRDGAFGLLAIRKRGGRTIAQDEQSSTIFGMPKAAIQLGAANEILAPNEIAIRITEMSRSIAATALRQRGGSL